MFVSLEGMAKDNAKMIDENGNLHVTHILDGLDSLYGVSMMFQSHNVTLCGLQQKSMESTCTYYNCMVVHLKDQLHTTPLDLLRAVLEQEENDALTRTC